MNTGNHRGNFQKDHMFQTNSLSKRTFLFFSVILLMVALMSVALLRPREAMARVRLENICSIYGQKEVKLTGLGLVVGLNGTGDGGRSRPTMRVLSEALRHMHLPTDSKELRDAKNVAVVLVEATIPKTGLRRGQKNDCHVSSVMGAKSLRSGRLLIAPLLTANVQDDTVVALASGPISIEDVASPTTGLIPGGAILETGFASPFVDKERGHIVTLLLDASHSSFHSSSEVARVINDDNKFDLEGREIARAIGPGVIDVMILEPYQDFPVKFVSQLLDVGIDNPHTQARIVVNPRTGSIVVTGEVEISPVIIGSVPLIVKS
jgi:flagellar P-ring protein precursor FlgI